MPIGNVRQAWGRAGEVDVGEVARLQALHGYEVLDAPADDELSAVVRAAAVVAGVPTATLNLIDENRQCQLTTVGFDGGDSARDDSMCAVVFADGRSTHVPDARLDARFAANPWVTGRLAGVRFYASVPLVTTEGHALGSLCVFHTEPHTLTGTQMAALEDLASVVMALFERRRQARRNAELADDARRAHELAATYARELEARQELMDAVLQPRRAVDRTLPKPGYAVPARTPSGSHCAGTPAGHV